MPTRLEELHRQAETDRKAGRWPQALAAYARLGALNPADAIVAHNLALCHLAVGDLDKAVEQSRHALTCEPRLWQAGVVQAKALIAQGSRNDALECLQTLHRQYPKNPEIRLELARLRLNLLGDPVGARQLVAALIDAPGHAHDARLLTLITQLYDRDTGSAAREVNRGFIEFAARHLQFDTPPKAIKPGAATRAHSRRRHRPRVGLLSPQFCASPVYFFTFGALKELAGAVDLVCFDRGHKADWATDAFKKIAHDWIDVAQQNAAQLAATLGRHDLDSLIDLGGWMDPVALLALSAKPARKQYKWVGGQSVTTGLKTFDGFFTDRYQTPAGSDELYSEPLIRLKAGYVTYTPPAYVPRAQPARRRQVRASRLGIIANPAKVSRAFLADLAKRHRRWSADSRTPPSLSFIDYRYQHGPVRNRIEAALPGIELEFVTPASHREYLAAVSRLDATLDTWPYSGGLTTIEAFAVGVPVFTRLGELFCERHTAAHCKYAGFSLNECRIDRFDGQPPARSGHSLLEAGSPRVDHQALAAELLPYLN